MKNMETRKTLIGFDPAAPENEYTAISGHLVRHHELKIAPQYFNRIRSGNKTAEFRLNDRDFREGDMMTLNEFKSAIMHYANHPFARYTGRNIVCRITDVTIVNDVYPNELRGKSQFVMISFQILAMNG